MKWKKVLSVLLSAAMIMGTVSPGLEVRAAEDAVSNVADSNSSIEDNYAEEAGSDAENENSSEQETNGDATEADSIGNEILDVQEEDSIGKETGGVQEEDNTGKESGDVKEQGKIVYYDFQSYDSTIINDASGNGKAGVVRNYDAGGFRIIDTNIYGKDIKALSLPGGSDGGYLELPVGLLDGEESVTISTWVKLLTDTGYQRIWDLGSGTSSYMYLLSDGANDGFKGYSAAITTGGWSREQGVSKGSNVDKNRWVLTTVVIDGTNMSLYENGSLVETKDTGISLKDMGHTTQNYIGYGQFGDDPTNAQYAEFEIYNYAMNAEQVASMYDVDDTGIVNGDAAALNLGDLTAVTTDMSLPAAGENGSVIEWTSSDPAVIANDGKVVRPAAGEPDAQVTLTATVKYQEA
ncbi:LamG domain-containing protein, partial [Robinsoniella peoriensis]